MDKIYLFTLIAINVLFLVIGLMEKKFGSPYFMFAVLWTFITVICTFFDPGWYSLTPETILILFCGNITILLSTFLFAHVGEKKEFVKVNFEEDKTKFKFNYNLFSILAIVYILLQLPTILSNLAQVKNGMNLGLIHSISIYSGEDGGSSLEKILSVVFLNPFPYVAMCVFGVQLFEKKENRKLIATVLSLVVVAFSVLLGGRRANIIFLAVICFVMFTKKVKYNFSKKQKLVFAGVLLALIVAVLVLTNHRSNGNADFISTIVGYFGGGVPSLNVRVNALDTSAYYGLALLHGVLAPIMIALHGVFGMTYPEWWLEIDTIIEAFDYVSIGETSQLNAFNTLYFVPYLDGGLLYVVLEMVLLGFILAISYKKFLSKDNDFINMIYPLLTVCIAGSMYTLYFTQYPYVLAFIYIFALNYNPKKKKRSK